MSNINNMFAQKTIYSELVETDPSIEIELNAILDEVFDSRTNFVKRQARKGMADILQELDSHVVDRATHMKQASNVITILAERLGLNSLTARIGMRGHDAGHPFGSHEGEEVLNIIGEMLHAGFFHHNAKGVDVVLAENIIEKFASAAMRVIERSDKLIKFRNDPNVLEKLRDDAWYFIELIVGYDEVQIMVILLYKRMI